MIRPVYIVMLLFSGVTALYYPSLIDIFFRPSIFNKEADAGHLINYEDVLKKAIDSFGAWEEREESSVEIVNKIRADKRDYAQRH